MQRSSVDLPEPLGPSTATSSPRSTVSATRRASSAPPRTHGARSSPADVTRELTYVAGRSRPAVSHRSRSPMITANDTTISTRLSTSAADVSLSRAR